jgi:hypothetical protein
MRKALENGIGYYPDLLIQIINHGSPLSLLPLKGLG